ncbi:MAG: FHA domain-containing protein [Pseudomonadota bacterium]
MSEQDGSTPPGAARRTGLLGSLREALAAAGRDDAMAGTSASAGAGAGRDAHNEPQLISESVREGAGTMSADKEIERQVQRQLQAVAPPPPPASAATPARGQTPPLPTDAAIAMPPVSLQERAAEAVPTPAVAASAQGGAGLSAAEAAARARGQAAPGRDAHAEADQPTTRAPQPRAAASPPRMSRTTADASSGKASAATQFVRGRAKVARTSFHQDPVVGWLVVVGGPGLGAFRPIFEGNNTVGRSRGQRVPIDFGDDTISSEEQAYIRYDSADRRFLFVPNLAKTNVVSVNDEKPTSALELSGMDVITMGRTQLVFVPFCSDEFDWSELTEAGA